MTNFRHCTVLGDIELLISNMALDQYDFVGSYLNITGKLIAVFRRRDR